MRSSHHLLSPASLLESAFALVAFRATPGTPHLELPSGRALKALHPSQGTSLKCIMMSNFKPYETRNSREGLTTESSLLRRGWREKFINSLCLIVIGDER